MNRSEAARMMRGYSLNAVNRVRYKSEARLDDPYKRLAAAVILQTAIDVLRNEAARQYWYYGKLVKLYNLMSDEDYRFYADIAGIDYTFNELLRIVEANHLNVRGKIMHNAAELLCI